jgi:hypothetical protein
MTARELVRKLLFPVRAVLVIVAVGARKILVALKPRK